MALADRRFICPACKQAFVWTEIMTHWQDGRDDAHIALESRLERVCDDAYFDAEVAFIEENCEEA